MTNHFRFATSHNLGISVFGTGHEFNDRNSGKGFYEGLSYVLGWLILGFIRAHMRVYYMWVYHVIAYDGLQCNVDFTYMVFIRFTWEFMSWLRSWSQYQIESRSQLQKILNSPSLYKSLDVGLEPNSLLIRSV